MPVIMMKVSIPMPDTANRDRFERLLTRELSKLLNEARTDFINDVYHAGFTQGELADLSPTMLRSFQEKLQRTLEPRMTELFIEVAEDYASMMSYAIDAGELATLANNWVDANLPLLINQLMDTTQNNLQQIADRAPDLPLDKNALGALLGAIGLFGLSRAVLIAQDQLTHARSGAEDSVNSWLIQHGGIRSIEEIWYTRRDERVCFRCYPLHGKVKGDGWTSPPPLHRRCRCERKFKITANDGTVFVVHSREEIDDGIKPVTIGR